MEPITAADLAPDDDRRDLLVPYLESLPVDVEEYRTVDWVVPAARA
jgi:hypothetical protein